MVLLSCGGLGPTCHRHDHWLLNLITDARGVERDVRSYQKKKLGETQITKGDYHQRNFWSGKDCALADVSEISTITGSPVEPM
jgi:hypothetical protein